MKKVGRYQRGCAGGCGAAAHHVERLAQRAQIVCEAVIIHHAVIDSFVHVDTVGYSLYIGRQCGTCRFEKCLGQLAVDLLACRTPDGYESDTGICLAYKAVDINVVGVVNDR